MLESGSSCFISGRRDCHVSEDCGMSPIFSTRAFGNLNVFPVIECAIAEHENPNAHGLRV